MKKTKYFKNSTCIFYILKVISYESGLGAQEILERLFSRLDRFVGIDNQLEDDASMVLLKVNEDLILPTLKRAIH